MLVGCLTVGIDLPYWLPATLRLEGPAEYCRLGREQLELTVYIVFIQLILYLKGCL